MDPVPPHELAFQLPGCVEFLQAGQGSTEAKPHIDEAEGSQSIISCQPWQRKFSEVRPRHAPAVPSTTKKSIAWPWRGMHVIPYMTAYVRRPLQLEHDVERSNFRTVRITTDHQSVEVSLYSSFKCLDTSFDKCPCLDHPRRLCHGHVLVVLGMYKVISTLMLEVRIHSPCRLSLEFSRCCFWKQL